MNGFAARTFLCGASLALALSISGWAGGPLSALTPAQLFISCERVEALYARERTASASPSTSARVGARANTVQAAELRLVEARAKSAALEQIFRVSITPRMLQAELDRMGREATQPQRLRELFTALDDDATAAAEVLARPLLADRLLRSAYASDRLLHAAERAQATRVLQEIRSGKDWPRDAGRLSECVVGGEACAASTLDGPRFDAEGRRVLSDQEWTSASSRWPEVGTPPRLEETSTTFVVMRARRTGAGHVQLEALTVSKRSFDDWWSETRPAFLGAPPPEVAANYQLPEVSTASPCGTLGFFSGQPASRTGAAAVWTGSELLYYGGETLATDASGLGGRFDPATGAYRQIPAGPWSYTPVTQCVAVWTGTRMVVFLPNYWADRPLEGAAYDPGSDSWTRVSQGAGCPLGMRTLSVVWSGEEVLVWGSLNDTSGQIVSTGARWNPSTNTWRAMSPAGAPSPRTGCACVWTGDEMIIFGGTSLRGGDPSYLSGARYSPEEDRWLPTSVQPATPACYQGFSAVWTGNEMIVWGGSTDLHGYVNTGGRYNPATDSWSATTLAGAPEARLSHTAVWTGQRMIIWGGVNGGPPGSGSETPLDTGGWYDPSTDRWTPTPIDRFCPSGRKGHIALWTGDAMMVWGGLNYSTGGVFQRQSNGGLLSEDGWHPLLLGVADTERLQATAGVWTGAELIVWGGHDVFQKNLASGAVYDPATGSWRPTATDWNTPSARYGCTAVWTGSEMLVWGGLEDQPWPYSSRLTWTGGRYDPALDRWEVTGTGPGTPLPRYGHSAIWAGDRMIVWGGKGDWNAYLNTGGLYDPVLDRWAATPTDGACPSPRMSTAAVWTDTEMILFGGANENSSGQTVWMEDGGRFSPSTGRWTALSSAGKPTARAASAAVWTGDMVIFWGGSEPSSPTLGTGAMFSPTTATWRPVTTLGACPLARSSPTSIWTGTRMLIWGGGVWQASNTSGAYYDPDADVWEEAPSGDGSMYGNESYIGGGTNPLLLFGGGERAGYTLSPCLSARAIASSDPTGGPLTARFQGFASGGESPYAYDWDFGDGSPHGSGKVVDHTYSSGGSHTFTVTVTDGTSAVATQSKSVEVEPPPTITAVKALASPFRLQVNGAQFKSGAQVDIDGAPVPTTQFSSSSQLVAGSGKTLKVMLPKGVTVTVRVTNPDGLQATAPFKR